MLTWGNFLRSGLFGQNSMGFRKGRGKALEKEGTWRQRAQDKGANLDFWVFGQ
jgi:hypothetical protein